MVTTKKKRFGELPTFEVQGCENNEVSHSIKPKNIAKGNGLIQVNESLIFRVTIRGLAQNSKSLSVTNKKLLV
jgi:hypothetical protein